MVPKGSLSIKVPNLIDIDKIRSIESVLNIPVGMTAPSATQLWGRISGVHPTFAEEDLLETLCSQGVEKVVREEYTTESETDGQPSKTQRPSNRVPPILRETTGDCYSGIRELQSNSVSGSSPPMPGLFQIRSPRSELPETEHTALPEVRGKRSPDVGMPEEGSLYKQSRIPPDEPS